MELLRSLLLVPVLDQHALDAARSSHADALVLDLADGVTPDRAEDARSRAHAAVSGLHHPHRGVWVRVHATSTMLAKADIRATAREQIAGYVLPHAQSANQVRYTEALLRDAEATAGLKDGSLKLIAVVESAEGLLKAQEISRATSRLAALALDGDGYCADMGVARSREGHELQYARGHVAVCARAAGLPALDTPYRSPHETRELLTDTATARSLGMHGKLIVSPTQAPVVNAVFTPTAEEIGYARRLQAAHTEAMERGEEFAHLDGRLIDAPLARRARRLVELATAIEAKEQQAAI